VIETRPVPFNMFADMPITGVRRSWDFYFGGVAMAARRGGPTLDTIADRMPT